MTTTLDDIKSTFLAPFEELAEQVSENINTDKLTLAKKTALEAIEEKEFPTTRNEEWKFTDIKSVISNNFELQSKEGSENSTLDLNELDYYLNSNKELDSHILVFINGYFSEKHSSIKALNDKISIKTLSNIEANSSIFDKFESDSVSIFSDINTAFAPDGYVIELADNQELELPVFVYFVNDASQKNTLSQVRNYISVGENSRCTVVENYITKGENPNLVNIVTSINVEKYANVKHLKIQADAKSQFQVGSTHAKQADNSSFTNTTISLAGKLIRNDLRIISGEHCESYMNGLYLLNEKTHVDNHTVIDHQRPNSYSNEMYKGVLDGKSRAVFNGKIFVRQAAQKTNAFQSNKNVLLSDDSILNTKPQLEIWADDVKCSHGATTGKLDEEALFYLQARGIPKQKAKSLLLQAFAEEVLDSIEIDVLREFLTNEIENRLSVQ
ncbi:Iron-regulated ABC transporter permease protein SufD [Bernardetia litoralis DSM 6794]|uniref:Iron-regulated ABC transporter permease protein SufD n=1 Tax=Bernardetia litoralis (strain ATCC 23117 / DSM 6794 / NBRC 15988 / NCIMB 1366 / Fx l1 / Sio-4) TaxID=880071 RepID=I4AM97_BERLS|nr:Fe-S cluster assembly protein SufD [Bernardetia litoralis]AFM05082.1 Iron-regulated ABC transporter permease protein SufD [Bernardetia litoralis DSM 6794]